MKNMNSKSGGVLLMAMLVLLAFSVLAMGLFKLEQTNALEAVYVEQTDQAFWIAEAGVQRAVNKLRDPANGGSYRAGLSTSSSSPTVETDTIGSNGSYSVGLWGDGLGSNFTVRSSGTMRGITRQIEVKLELSLLGPYGLVTLDGDSSIRQGATITGDVYQNGELTVRSGSTINGSVLAENHEDFASGVAIPEDGLLELSIDQSPYTPLISLADTGTTIPESLDLSNSTVVVSSSVDPSSIVSTGGPGTLVIKGNQTFSKDFSVGDNITIVVAGDLIISKNGFFGDNVTMFATGEMDLFKNATADASTGTGCSFLALGDMKIKKELQFDGMIFSEGSITADKDLNVTGTIITEDGFTLKKDATVNFSAGVIPPNAAIGTYFVKSSSWREI